MLLAENRSRTLDFERVVVLSDDAGFLRLMREFFSEIGFEPVTHPEQHGPVCFVERMHPQLVVLDILVPSQRLGWLTLEALVNHPDTLQTPVIVCAPATWVFDSHAELLERDGVRRWDPPFDFGDLLQLIQELVPTARLSRQAPFRAQQAPGGIVTPD